MSIAVLSQVYDETRRLAVAGSAVARGDFRLKKLLTPLEQAGAKAPVFAKVAEHARAVVDGPEATTAESLLELASLVTAVLYTQGETGCPGTLEHIETTDLGGSTAQAHARVLKPLLEALSSTGSGRLELVKDAHARGVFRDLRLVKPALEGLDDPYAEVADFLAEKVVPLYGKSVVPELRAKFDPKGTKGHSRRLALMHALDPDGTRDMVKQALDAGSKEVKVAAIGCLGAAAADLQFLIEQAAAKAADVRQASYQALATVDDPAAVAVLEKALAGKDLALVAEAISRGVSDTLTGLLVAEIGKDLDLLLKSKDKKQVGEKAGRLCRLVRALPDREHEAADAVTLDLFARRAELMKAKADASGATSGFDVVAVVIRRMVTASKPLQTALARGHAGLEAGDLPAAVEAARYALPPAEVYDLFAPYLNAAGDKKKGTDAARREALISALGGDYHHLWYREREGGVPPLDPRWLDLAVWIKHRGMVRGVGRPGHPAAEAFLQAEFDATIKKPQPQDELRDAVAAMVRLRHPRAADALVRAVEKTIGKPNTSSYWYTYLIPELPASAVPLLEGLLPKLKDHDADRWVELIQELRNKK